MEKRKERGSTEFEATVWRPDVHSRICSSSTLANGNTSVLSHSSPLFSITRPNAIAPFGKHILALELSKCADELATRLCIVSARQETERPHHIYRVFRSAEDFRFNFTRPASGRLLIFALNPSISLSLLPGDVVTWLDVSCGIVMNAIPPYLVTMKHLTYLDVTNCGLMELPTFINNLPSLCVLLASRNKLNGLPTTVTELGQLEIVDLGENLLQDCHLAGFERLENLRVLNISFTLVKNLIIGSISTLIVLHESVFDTCSVQSFLSSKESFFTIDKETSELGRLDRKEHVIEIGTMAKQVMSFCLKARQKGGLAEMKPKVLVMGDANTGKSTLISYLQNHFAGLLDWNFSQSNQSYSLMRHKYSVYPNYLFTEVNSFIKPNACYYSCCLIVMDCSNPNFSESLYQQLDYAVCHCNIQLIYFVVSKLDLCDANLMNTRSILDSILNLAESWKQKKAKNLTFAKSCCTAMIEATADYKTLYQEFLLTRIELQNKLCVLKKLSFKYFATSAITREGLVVLASNLSKLECHRRLYPQPWIQVQEDCMAQLHLTSDCKVICKRTLDLTESLHIDSVVENESNLIALRILRFLLDTFVVQQKQETGNVFLFTERRSFEKIIERLTLTSGCSRCSRGVLDLSCLKQHFKNNLDLENFVTLLANEDLCIEACRWSTDSILTAIEWIDDARVTVVDNFLKNSSSLLLPWLLPETELDPLECTLRENLKESKPYVTKVIYRVCNRLPFALFHQACIRMLKVPHTKRLDYWKQGVAVNNSLTTAILKNVETSDKSAHEILACFSIAETCMSQFQSQFWCFIGKVIKIIEMSLREWNWTVYDRMWLSDSVPSFFETSNISFSLIHDLCVSEVGPLVLFTSRSPPACDTNLKDAKDTELTTVFRYSALTEAETATKQRIEITLDPTAVRDGLRVSSVSHVQPRNVMKDPFDKPSKHPHMTRETERLESFRRWPSFAPKIVQALAESGFFYSGVRDEVVCFHCDVNIGRWNNDDNPDFRHLGKSPCCEVAKQRTGNTSGNDVKAKWFEAGSSSTKYSSSSIPSMTQSQPLLLQTSTTPNFSRQGHQQPSNLMSGFRPDVTTEAGRLATFDDRWSRSYPVKPVDLARSGFYYTGRLDSVQCFSCKVVLRGWEEGDKADDEHERHAPYCSFLNRLVGDLSQHFSLPPDVQSHSHRVQPEPSTVSYKDEDMQSEKERLLSFWSARWLRDVSIRAEEMASAGLYSVGGNVVRCFHCRIMLREWLPHDVPIEEHVKHSPHCRFAKAVAQKVRLERAEPSASATAESMADYRARLASFVNWPTTSPIRPQPLAAAGFYYAGSGDRVRCFSCGNALKDWQPGDNAWIEHGRHFPGCVFFQENAPPEIAVTVSGYDEPWSAEMSTGTSLHSIRKGELPPWSFATNKSLTEPLASVRKQEAASQNERQWGVNQSYLDQAEGMGFDRGLAERVIATNMQFTGRPYTDINAFIDDVIKTERERRSSKLDSQSSRSDTSAARISSLKKPSQQDPLAALKEMATGVQLYSEASNKEVGSYLETTKEKHAGGVSEKRKAMESREEFLVGINAESGPTSMEAEASTGSSLEFSAIGQSFLSALSLSGTRTRSQLTAEGGPTLMETETTIGSSLESSTTGQPFLTASSSSETRSRPESTHEDDELRELQQRKLCKVCFDEEINIIFLDCGHLVCCDVCADRVVDCPICRKPIKRKLRAIFA
ncbi:uncharacterized protein LOC134186550 [Corticium candelabrum]|uniref:uncharacterized protein LOC134186550 n=1 Tax=Corticium candelabrum TaxID=121492 RepID=UPI002E2746EC|nr:uncharacterized protein LOC134186550 [Corticium candelabrum]